MSDVEVERALRQIRGAADPEAGHVDDGVLIALCEGRLGVEAQAEVDRHLVTCGGCRALLVELSAPLREGAVDRGMATAHAARSQRRWVPWATAAAIVVAVGGGLWWSRSSRELPRYALTGLDGAAAVRSAETKTAGTPVYRSTTPVELVVRPERAVRDTALEAAMFVSRPGGALVRAPISVQRSEQGSFALRGESPAVFADGPGAYEVTVAVLPRAGACARVEGLPLSKAREACAEAIFWEATRVEYAP